MHTYASHNTCEHLQILSTSTEVLGIQNISKPVPSGSNVNVYTITNYIHMCYIWLCHIAYKRYFWKSSFPEMNNFRKSQNALIQLQGDVETKLFYILQSFSKQEENSVIPAQNWL